jgi:hypothetical protein
MRATYYRHSGQFSPVGVFVALLGGLAGGAVLAFVYAYALAYIPIVGYITFILSAGFGALVGLVTGKLLQRGHVRSSGVSTLVALVVALGAFYVSWAAWISAMAGRADAAIPIGDLLTRPDLTWELIQAINAVGAWTMKGWTPTGGVLWGLWGLEAALILVPAMLVGIAIVGGHPYCESCRAWCTDQEGVLNVAYSDPAEVRRRLEGGDLAYLESLGRSESGAHTWVRIDLHRCPTASCGRTNTLSAHIVQVTVNNKGESSQKATAVVDKLLVEKAAVENVLAIGQRQQVA